MKSGGMRCWDALLCVIVTPKIVVCFLKGGQVLTLLFVGVTTILQYLSHQSTFDIAWPQFDPH